MTGRDRVLFIRVIENKCPRLALGWIAGRRINSSLQAPGGSGGREERQTCPLPRWRRHRPAYPWKIPAVIFSVQTSSQDLFRCPLPAQRNPVSSHQPVLCQPCVGTSWFVNPKSRSKAWPQGSCRPPRPQHKARLPLPGGCAQHVVELGERTDRDKYPCVAEDGVKGVNWPFYDRNPDSTLSCAKFWQDSGFKIVHTLDLPLIWAPTSMVSWLEAKKGLSTFLRLLASLLPVWQRGRCRHCRKWEDSILKRQYDWLKL